MLTASENGESHFFLPDLCAIRSVFRIVIIAQLLSFVLLLARPPEIPDLWQELALISLFVQWVALLGAAVLCLSRPLLRRVSTPLAATLGFGIILLITAGLSEAAFFLVLDELAFTPMPKDMHAEFLLCNLGISAIFGGIALRYFYVQQQWRRQIQAETEARRQALQARIRPHFLFNSLNTITSLVEAHPRRAEQALLDLADLFRASLDNKHGLIPLADELELVQHYLNIEQLRLGDRLQVKWATDDLPQDALVPVLSIQPLIENAVYYGIEPTPQGGMIDIQGDYDNDKIRISIHSPLPKAQPSTRQHSSQMAQDNIRERLHVYFGKQGNLVVASDRGTYQVDMHLRYTRTPP